MNKNKVILAIDASSTAIGYSLMDKDKVYMSGTITCHDADKLDQHDRVEKLLDMFKDGMKEVHNKAIELGCKDILLNASYVPTNATDSQGLGLRIVQDVILYMFYIKKGWNYIPVLDSSWTKALADYVKWPGAYTDLNKRAEKKKNTVIAALKIKGIEFSSIQKVKGHSARYSYTLIPNEDAVKNNWCVEGNGIIEDDEADAIFAGWSFLNGLTKDTTILSRQMKMKRDKIEKYESVLNVNKTRYETLQSWIAKRESEIISYKEKDKIKKSVVNEKAIKNREIEINQFKNEMIEIEPVIKMFEEKIEVIKNA